MTVSAALIVKNEERTLGRCLASIQGAVDEIVVVDTGSTDATKKVARRYKARVVDFPWRDDFSAARQFAFDQATGDWVFWLDADDVVIGADQIRLLVAAAAPDVGGFYWRYVLGRDARGEPTFTYWRERCVRNDGAHRWVGRVHEVLVAGEPRTLIKADEVIVEHHPEAERGEPSNRNLRILEDEYARSHGSPEPRILFYLGREYADTGNVPRAIEILERYVAVGHWDDERYIAQVRVADLYRGQGNYAKALDAYWSAIKIHPRWPDAYFGLTATYYFLRDWPKVVHWAEIAQTIPTPETLLFLNTRGYDYDWIIYYTNALHHVGRLQEALSWTRRALTLAPDDQWHQQNLAYFTSTLDESPSTSSSSL